MPSPRAWWAWRMRSVLSLRKQVSTCSATQSQQMPRRRLSSIFHEVINFLTVLLGLSEPELCTNTRKGLRSTLGALRGARVGIMFGEPGGGCQPGAQAHPESRTERGGKARWAKGTSECQLFLEGHSQACITTLQEHPSLCFLPAAWFLTFGSSKVEAGHSTNDTCHLIEAVHGSQNSKYVA